MPTRHSHRMGTFQRSLATVRKIRRDLKDAAALLELLKHKGLPWQPADHGFVFSKDQVERVAQHKKDINASRHIEYVLFQGRPPIQREGARPASANFGTAV